MLAAQRDMTFPDPSFRIKKVLVDKDMVAVHTELLSSKIKPGEGGLRQVHLFRFGRGNKIVEYWDISQFVRPDMPNAAGAF
jgi:predicted SnoaL-like aldol condensation-catalyzing enzyme